MIVYFVDCHVAVNRFAEIEVFCDIHLTAVHCSVTPEVDAVDMLVDVAPRVFDAAVADGNLSVDRIGSCA